MRLMLEDTKEIQRNLMGLGPKASSSLKLKLLEPETTLRTIEFSARSSYHEAKEKINPRRSYTVSQASRISGINDNLLYRLILPAKTTQKVRFLSAKNHKNHYTIKGETLVTILEELERNPLEHLVDAKEIAKVCGITFGSIQRNFIQKNDKLFLGYNNHEEERVAIPIYRVLGRRGLFVDKRAVDYVKKNEEQKRERMSWDQVVDYLQKENIEVLERGLLYQARWLSFQSRKKVFMYPLLSGEKYVLKLCKAKTKAHGKYYYACSEVKDFARKLREEEKIWMTYKEFLEKYNKGKQRRPAQIKKDKFSLDGVDYNICLVKRNKIFYIKKTSAIAYVEWIRIIRSKTHINLRFAYRALKKEQTEKRRKELDDIRINVGGKSAFAVSKKYGIAVIIRECSGIEKINKKDLDILRFYLNLRTADKKRVSDALCVLEKEIKKPAVEPVTIIKLWILRHYYIDLTVQDQNSSIVEAFFSNEHITQKIISLMLINLSKLRKLCEEQGNQLIFFEPGTDEISRVSYPMHQSPLSEAQVYAWNW